MNILFYGFRHGHIFDCYRNLSAHKDFTVLAGIEENDNARNAAEEKLQTTLLPGGYEEWLADPRVEAVAIGGAYGNRGQAIIRALQSGKHILADKPLCTSLKELEEIRRLAKEKNLKIGCLLDLRKMPATQQVRNLLSSGEFGAIRNISFGGQHCIDYANRPGWYFEKGMHGGTINDITIHALDLIPYITGHTVNQVHYARTWNGFATRHPDFLDCAAFMAQTDKGATVMADVSYAAPSQVFSMPTYWNFKLWCDGGVISFCWADPNVTVYRNGETAPEILPGIPAETTLPEDFLAEVLSDTHTFTDSVLSASEIALKLQAAANAGSEGVAL